MHDRSLIIFGIRMSQRSGRAPEALDLMLRLWTEEEVTHYGPTPVSLWRCS